MSDQMSSAPGHVLCCSKDRVDEMVQEGPRPEASPLPGQADCSPCKCLPPACGLAQQHVRIDAAHAK